MDAHIYIAMRIIILYICGMPNSSQQLDMQQKTGLTRVKKPRSGWHREDIKAALRKRGITLAKLSQHHGYFRDAASTALAREWPAVERIIADQLGMEPWELWPERYNEYGQPVQAGNPNMVKLSHAGRPRNAELKAVE